MADKVLTDEEKKKQGLLKSQQKTKEYLEELKRSFDNLINGKTEDFLTEKGELKTEFLNSPLIQTYYNCFNVNNVDIRRDKLSTNFIFDDNGERLPENEKIVDETKKEILYNIFNIEGEKKDLFERAIIERGRLEGKYTYKQLTCESDASSFLQGLYDNNELFKTDGTLEGQRQEFFQALTTKDMVKLITSKKTMQPEMHYEGLYLNDGKFIREDFKVSYGVAESGNEKHIIKQVVTRVGGGRPQVAMYVLPMGRDKDGNEFVDEKNAIMFFRSDRTPHIHENKLDFFKKDAIDEMINFIEKDVEGYHQHYPTLITSGLCNTKGYGNGNKKENNESHAISEEKLADYIDFLEGRNNVTGFDINHTLGLPVKEILESGNNLNIDLTSVIDKVKEIDPEFDKDDEFKNCYKEPESGKGYLLAQSLRVKVAIDKLAAKDEITLENKQKLFNCLEETCNEINSAMLGYEQAKGNEIVVNAEGLKVFEKMGGLYTEVDGKVKNNIRNRVDAENFYNANKQNIVKGLSDKAKHISKEAVKKVSDKNKEVKKLVVRVKNSTKEFKKITKDMDKNSPEYLMLNEAYTNAVNQSNLAKDSIDEMKEASNETQAAADKVEEFAKKNEEAKKAIKKGENTVENEKIVEETKEEVLKQEGKTQDGLNKVEYSEIYAENMVKKANEMVDELEKLLEREKSKSSDSAITKSATTETTKNETKSASSKNGKEA